MRETATAPTTKGVGTKQVEEDRGTKNRRRRKRRRRKRRRRRAESPD